MPLSRRARVLLAVAVAGIIATATILTAPMHSWGTQFHLPTPAARTPGSDAALLEKLAIIFPINENTDMQFYRNTWMRDYLYPVCDWPGDECKIVCNEQSTYKTLDKKTFCFSRAMKEYRDKEFFIKIDDDALVDKGYILGLVRNYTGWDKPVYISDHQRYGDGDNPSVDGVLYGNGKFYMFNRKLVDCVDVNLKYEGHRIEDAIFGAMVRSGCGEPNVEYVVENDNYIWHKTYKNKNKYIDLAFIKNH
ncbi:hypothetical protein H4R21_001823 [Coemansia helicoidea]|uniref:Uncharacterized protein n=1 Tax=Coemansia helicoidea TaxID=1286919 RepID=A0ACC1LB17_9FUNG|nr:hypothetical protein H4R21_001823 [Coemansia helicoidea]